MDSRTAFKFGYMARCIADGYTSVEQMHKIAFLDLGKLGGSIWDTAKDIGLSVLVGGPAALGALGGYGLGKVVAGGLDGRPPVEKIKNQELIDEYREQTARLKREQAIRQAGMLGQSSY